MTIKGATKKGYTEAIQCAACCVAIVDSLDCTLLKDLTAKER